MSLRALTMSHHVSWALLGCTLWGCSGTITSPELEPLGERDGPERAGSASSSARSDGGTGGNGPSSTGMDLAGGGEVSDGGLMAAGRGGSGGASTPMNEKVFCDAVTKVFIPRCGGGSCHSRPDVAFGDFAVGTAEAESFVNVPSVRNPVCGLVIDPVNPSDSLILRKLIGDFLAPTCGGAMPVTGGDLTDDQIDCVASWVQKFAGSE